jgi:hypothetical protein
MMFVGREETTEGILVYLLVPVSKYPRVVIVGSDECALVSD